MDTQRLRFKGINGVEFPKWKKTSIEDLFEVSAGGDLDKDHFSHFKDDKHVYPIYANALTNGGLFGYSTKYTVAEKSITVTGRGEVGHATARDGKYTPIVRLLVCKPKNNQNTKFFEEAINRTNIVIESTGVPQLTVPQLKRIILPVPSLPEQQKIADLLSSYDEKISIQRERVESLERRKKGLLQKIFSQEIRFKAEDGGIYEKWESKTIGDVTVPTAGATPSTKNGSYWIGGDIPWMSSGEVHNGQVFKTEKFITAKGYSNSSTKLLPPNTVVVALAGQGKTRGSVAITRIKLCTNQSLAGLVLKEGSNVISDYLYQYLKNQYSELRKVSSGDGGRGGLNLNIISEFPIILPSLKEQRKIADFFTVIDDQINIEKERLVTMEAIKKGLLQGLFC